MENIYEQELATLRAELDAQPARWGDDSSLETWFPYSAEEIGRLRAELASERRMFQAAVSSLADIAEMVGAEETDTAPFNIPEILEDLKRAEFERQQLKAEVEQLRAYKAECDGWIAHTTGKIPVNPDDMVRIIDKYGRTTSECGRKAGIFDWEDDFVVSYKPLSIPSDRVASAPHTDDIAVDRFAELMKQKLAKARDKGRGGWDNPLLCKVEDLARMLVDHIPKGDPIDVANFAMMLCLREGGYEALKSVAAKPTARITEQDAREIIASASLTLDHGDRSIDADYWLNVEGRTLLNKLNAGRVSVPVMPEEIPDNVHSAINWQLGPNHKIASTATGIYGTIRNELLSASPAQTNQSALIERAYREGWETGWAERHSSLENDARVRPWVIPAGAIDSDWNNSEAKKGGSPAPDSEGD